MKVCEECSKKLGVFEGYQHPTMGKKHNLCSPCFDQVSESVARWGEFVRTNAFDMNVPKNNSQLNWKEMIANFNQSRNILDQPWTEKEILLQK